MSRRLPSSVLKIPENFGGKIAKTVKEGMQSVSRGIESGARGVSKGAEEAVQRVKEVFGGAKGGGSKGGIPTKAPGKNPAPSAGNPAPARGGRAPTKSQPAKTQPSKTQKIEKVVERLGQANDIVEFGKGLKDVWDWWNDKDDKGAPATPKGGPADKKGGGPVDPRLAPDAARPKQKNAPAKATPKPAAKGTTYPVYPKNSSQAASFRAAFAAARRQKAQVFTWEGRKYNTKLKGE